VRLEYKDFSLGAGRMGCAVGKRPWRTLKFETTPEPKATLASPDAYFTALVERSESNQPSTAPDESGGGLSQSLGWASSDPDRA
jgi:hypothetical protein